MPENEKQINGVDIGRKVITSISMSKEELEKLDLLALACYKTRSTMITQLVSGFCKDSLPVKKIVERIFIDYLNSDTEFETFIGAATVWLTEKKISPYYVGKIIAEVRSKNAKK